MPIVVVINASHSEDIGVQFVKYGVNYVICCKRNFVLDNTMCSVFSKNFYHALFENDNDFNVIKAFKYALGKVYEESSSSCESNKWMMMTTAEE